MKLHVVLLHYDGTGDPSTVAGVTKDGLDAAKALALRAENLYEDDPEKWDQLEWIEEPEPLGKVSWVAPTNSSMGSYEIVETDV